MSVLSSNAIQNYSNTSITYITESANHHSFLPQNTAVLLDKLYRNLIPPRIKVGGGQEEGRKVAKMFGYRINMDTKFHHHLKW